ncbi:hypothetical protein PTTW11_11396 [Pyrenophora teres f. teres]|uniref:Uncharacterized protein n=1 Tax=Pyrenophora teres f. teres TaxID=97479 RepID=A0A6S6WHV5_9PLEO|nr:hypothetical protein PTTW11_11396 [Pyrenophora teres f. teres]
MLALTAAPPPPAFIRRSLLAVLHIHDGLAPLPVSPGSPALLRVIQHAKRPIYMDNAPDIGHVYSYANALVAKYPLLAAYELL